MVNTSSVAEKTIPSQPNTTVNNGTGKVSKRKVDDTSRHAPKPKPLGFDGIGFDQYWI